MMFNRRLQKNKAVLYQTNHMGFASFLTMLVKTMLSGRGTDNVWWSC